MPLSGLWSVPLCRGDTVRFSGWGGCSFLSMGRSFLWSMPAMQSYLPNTSATSAHNGLAQSRPVRCPRIAYPEPFRFVQAAPGFAVRAFAVSSSGRSLYVKALFH